MKKALLFLLAGIALRAQADVILPAVLASHMVLQQKTTTKIWGWAGPGEKIAVTTSWNNHTDSTAARSDARWSVDIATPEAGGPFTITIQGHNRIVLDDVLIGEVWVCSGQSNMEWNGDSKPNDMADELARPANPQIRLCYVSKAEAAGAQEDCHASWAVCDPASLRPFSAVGYYFGKKLQENLHVPIGLIGSNWGATAAEVWTPDSLIEANPVLRNASKETLKPNPWCPVRAGGLYNAMIYPLLNFSIAGAIWYQGETNTASPFAYRDVLATMIGAWRAGWRRDFPFYLVQIAPFTYGKNTNAAFLREAQQRVTATVPNTGLVVTTDLVTDTTNIHPPDKHDVGMRLANYALAQTYHRDIPVYKSASYKSMVVQKGRIVVSFADAGSGIYAAGGKDIAQVYVAGADRVFHPAQAKVAHGELLVWSPAVPKPAAVRYGFTSAGIGNLVSGGLPVAPFRTDDWNDVP